MKHFLHTIGNTGLPILFIKSNDGCIVQMKFNQSSSFGIIDNNFDVIIGRFKIGDQRLQIAQRHVRLPSSYVA